jgi:hypothetical protein
MSEIKLSPRRIFLAVMTVLIAIQLLSNLNKERKLIAEIEREPSRVICLGRLLIDMPTRFEASYGMTYFEGWHINSRNESAEEFRNRVHQRIDSLAKAKNERGGPSLEVEKDIRNGTGKILQFDRESLRVVENGVISYEDIVKHEGYINAHGVSFDISAGVTRESDFGELERLVNRIKVRGEDEIPSERGFCIDRGIVLGDENERLSEGITLFAGYSNSNDVALVINSTAGTKTSDTLIQRLSASSIRQQYPSSFKNLRMGARKIESHIGEEVLTRVTEDDGRNNHTFMWESIPVKDDVYRPQIAMELSTGYDNEVARRKTPFTDDEALALWDRITRTLRNRPVN